MCWPNRQAGRRMTDRISRMKVFLVGYMGSGKSTLGPALAARLGIPFVDLDSALEASAGISIGQWFADRGEADFREAESRMIRERCGDASSFVMAAGGGAPAFHGNMEAMNRSGITVYLRCPEDVLVSRLIAQRTHRPLLASLREEELPSFIRAHLHVREAYYEESQIAWEDQEDVESLAARIRALG